MPREAWTDERLDDFRSDVDRRFDEVDRRFDKVETKIENTEHRLDAKIDALAVRMEERFDSLNRTIIVFSSVLIAGLLTMVGIQL